MKRLKTILLIIGATILIVTWLAKEVFSRNGAGGIGNPKFAPVPSTPQPVAPSIFLIKWSIDDVINSFKVRNIEIMNIKPVTESDYKPLPDRADEGVKFSVSSLGEDTAGCILSFKYTHSLEKVKRYYQKLNKKRELHSWTFVKDNILLVLDGKMPEEKAREYERALNDLKK